MRLGTREITIPRAPVLWRDRHAVVQEDESANTRHEHRKARGPIGPGPDLSPGCDGLWRVTALGTLEEVGGGTRGTWAEKNGQSGVPDKGGRSTNKREP
ncbi:unnamed protein product [Arctogadus glacialis]